MCLTVVKSKRIPTAARWAYKTLIAKPRGAFESSVQAFTWTPGVLHVPEGRYEIQDGAVNEGVFHCFTSIKEALRELTEYGNQQNEFVVRVRIPEHCIRCVGYYDVDRKQPNIGVRLAFLPKTKYLLYKGRWTELDKVLKKAGK